MATLSRKENIKGEKYKTENKEVAKNRKFSTLKTKVN